MNILPSTKILSWYDRHGRKDLPWQINNSVYAIWVSEVMLQQTQVVTVIPYFERFMVSFPRLEDLASATQDEVLDHWSGLGYYSRGRNLHKTAQIIMQNYCGQFPRQLDQLIQLPGLGRSTAAAILSLAYGQKQAILDGNVKRVLARYYLVDGWSGHTQVQKKLWELAERSLPNTRNDHYTQAMMDMGATLCTRTKPACLVCPIHKTCQAFLTNKVTLYPVPKPKKCLPKKSVTLLIIRNKQGNILLQKRPPIGIWSAMWSFPEFTDDHALLEWAKDHTQADFSIEKMKPIQHTFSHYRLLISPILLSFDVDDPMLNNWIMEAPPQFWYNNQIAFKGGIPAPITKIISRIFK